MFDQRFSDGDGIVLLLVGRYGLSNVGLPGGGPREGFDNLKTESLEKGV